MKILEDLYRLRLIILLGSLCASQVHAQNINRPNISGPAGLQINSFTGNLFYQRNDLLIPGDGLPIDMSFSYNSFRDSVNLGFGKGWILSYNMGYTKNGDTVFIERMDGRKDAFVQNADGISFRPPLGIFDALTRNGVDKFLLTAKEGARFYFEEPSHKKVTKIQDANNNSVTLVYSGSFLSSISNSSGRSVRLTWKNQLLAGVEEENSNPLRAVKLEYDGNNHLVKVTHPDNTTLTYDYAENGKLSALTDRNGNIFQVTYNASGQASALKSCVGTQRINYSQATLKTYVIEESNSGKQTTTYTFDEKSNVIKKEGNCCGFSNGYEYDSSYNVAKRTDGNGYHASYKYDNRGNLLTVADANGRMIKMEYEPAFNRITKITDKKNNSSTFQYDVSGNLKQIDLPLGISNTITYNSKGRIQSLKDGNTNTTQFEYDAQGNLTKLITPAGSETYAYDQSGNLISATDATNNKIQLGYDNQNRLLTAKDPLNNEISYTYDGNGNIKTQKDASNHLAEYGYDGLDRLIRVQSPAGVTNYNYDAHGNMISMQDANQHASTYQYNSKNLVETEKDAAGNQTRYSYDNNGNTMSRTDANGKLTTYQYDALNRLIKKTYDGNSDIYSYDESGNLASCRNNSIEMNFRYDALNRLTGKTIVNWNKTISYTYDNNSNRLTMTDPDGGITRYTYDANNRLTQIANPANKTIKFTYDNAGRLTRQNNFNGTYAVYEYDAASRLISLVHYNASAEEIAAFRYTYDKNGNRLTMADKQGTHQYSYDESDRVKDVLYANGTAEKYAFDATGNRISLVSGMDSTNYTYDAADHLQTDGKASYSFDGNGNLVKKTTAQGATVYEYDGENRLTKVTLPGGAILFYQYDPFGNRIVKQKGSEQTKYFLDGENVLMELGQSGTTEARYTSGLGLDSWLSMERNGTAYLYHQDGLGSIGTLTNESAGIAASYQYDVYGNITQTGNVLNPYTFTGREYDADIDLYYYRSRYYDARSGRFTGKDKFIGVTTRPLSFNKYGYVEGNPVNYTDPKGFFLGRLIFRLIIRYLVINTYKNVFAPGAKEKHCNRNDFNQTPAGNPAGINEDFVDENGLKWNFQPPGKSTFHFPYWKYTSPDGDGSFEGIWDPIKKRWVGGNEKGGPSYNYVDPKGDAWDFLWDPSVRGHFWEDMVPYFAEEAGFIDCNDNSGDQDKNPADNPKGQINIPILRSVDPNDIAGPSGYAAPKWVSKSSSLPYTIRFENDPDFATGAAQNVTIKLPIDDHIDLQSLQLGNFGFGKYVFTVPANSKYYSATLDVKDSLGVVVDVLAGIDLAKREAFWIFESKDPVTGLTPQDAHLGFLPVNDSTTGSGEGFVSFTLSPGETVKTGDSLRAQASIVFDINEPIPTNRWVNTADAAAPVSSVNSMPSFADSVFMLTWAGKDDSLGVGVHYYDLYMSKNNGPYSLYREKLTADTTAVLFTGEKGALYSFYTLATDYTGNREAAKNKADQTVLVKGNGVYLSVKAMLQGPFNTTSGMMTDSLRSKSLLPAGSPYSSLGFTAVNNQLTETTAASVFDSTGNKAVTDWVWLELRNSSNPTLIVATRSALIRRDGSVVDLDGYSPVYFNNVSEGNYFVAIRHRNHFGVMTAAALSLSKAAGTSIDFTSPQTPTYGTNAQRNVNGVMAMWAGDVNRDKRISYNGASNDKTAILQKVGLASPNNVVVRYDIADLNLDGLIRYNGASNDKTIILGNVGLSTSNNVLTEQLPK